jgi:site-specific DNA recombinase
LFRKRLISSADIEKQLTKIALEKNTLEKRASELEYNLIKVNISSAQRENAVDMLNNLKEKIINSSAITFELKREIIRILIDNIVINTTLTDNGKQKTVATINYKFGVDDCTDMDS